MVVVAEVVKRTFCVFCKHWRQLSSLRIGRRGSYSKCGRNYGKEEARVDPELGNYADFIHSPFSAQPTQWPPYLMIHCRALCTGGLANKSLLSLWWNSFTPCPNHQLNFTSQFPYRKHWLNKEILDFRESLFLIFHTWLKITLTF